MAEKFDTEQIKRDNPLSDYLPRRGFNLKRDGREWKCLCPFHAETDASFTIFQSREGFQKYQCFPCGAFGNVIDFVQEYDGVTFPEACEILGGTREAPVRERAPLPTVEAFDPYAGFEILDPPADAATFTPGKRTPQLRNPKRESDDRPKFVTYTPTLVHPYRTADGSLVGYVLRVDLDATHKITPLLLWARKDEWQGWTHHPMPEPRQLYGLDRIAAAPSKQWLVVEGEKCADVATELLPALVAVSWQGGGKAPHRSDWSPAKGKSVVVWMDNDDEGERTVLGFWKADDWRPGVAELLLRAGAKSVKVIGRNHTKPKGWDVADAHIEDGWGADEILAYAKDKARVWTLSNIEGRKASLKNSGSVTAPPGPDSPAGESNPSPATSRPQMKVVAGGQAVTASARQPQPERVVVPGEVPQIKRYSTALAIDDTVELDLLQRYEMDDKGNPKKKSLHNYIAASRYHPHMKDVLAWDEFAGKMVLARRPPWIAGTGPWEQRAFDDDDARLAAAWFSRQLNLNPKEDECGKAMLTASKANRINPVRAYLESLQWDGVSRIQGEANICAPWLTEYMGVRDTVINRAFGTRWLVSAVARIIEAGCKVDTMLILEGGQGAGKSTALRILATIGHQSYFTDSVHDIVGKEAVQQIRGKWIIEFSELDAMSKHDFNAVKAVVSRQVDNIRVPYAKHAEDFPRACVFAGTVNPSGTGYLKDPTGARRFWPVTVARIDTERLAADKDQLWAEAVHLYRQGMQWHLTDDEVKMAQKVQAARQEQEPWAEAIDGIIKGKNKIVLNWIREGLGIQLVQWNSNGQSRVANYLRSIGWERTKKRFKGYNDGKPVNCFAIPGASDD
ncbi:VapE domain-containing protein [Microvirga mediterraneensis]|uniref:Zinc finger CHC2-type domain-containing protein n=1 Tax=Microvirga mediterraneensis TaxID=2754695 RepID=A0A838BUZ2_9HYPH|nr:VapE domain-containing protein [Microvirga mediterraneensis]MBA1159357.1 hypothetical protein [Microvirga mediterraneensis]